MATRPFVEYGREMKTTGLYRVTLEEGEMAWAQVTDGSRRFNVPEEMYRSQAYEPAFDALPTKTAFEEAVSLGLMVKQVGLDVQPPSGDESATSH